MDDSNGTLHTVVRHLVLALQPLKEAAADVSAFRTFLFRLGWNATSLPPEYEALAGRVDAAVTALEALAEDPQPVEILAVLGKVRDVHMALENITTAPDGVDAQAFLAELTRDVFDLLLADYLESALPSVHAALLALDVLTQRYTEETPARPAVLVNRFHWEEIPKILADPISIPARVYGWGTDDVDFHRLARHLLEFFIAANFPAYVERVAAALGRGFQDAPDELDHRIQWALKIPVVMDSIGGQTIEVGLALLELPPQGTRPAGLILQPLVPSQIGTTLQLTENLKLELRAGSDLGTAFGVVLRPEEIAVRFPLQEGTALPQAGFGMALRYAPESPALLLGSAGNSRLELKGAATTVDLDFRNGELELRLQAAPEDLKLVVAPTDLDGFLAELLGRSERVVPVVLGVAWSNRTGFNFTGGAGLEISTHPHLSLGPITVERIDLGIKSTFDTAHPPDLKLQVGTVLGGSIGPVSFSADGLGVALSLIFADGNAGPFDIDYSFMPPKGLGIAVDAGPIAGGGFLSFDKEKGRYAGAVEVTVFEYSLKAIGFVETRLPDGSPGYSFVILISVEFTPIQLGLGFTLNGVGGLVAIHRRLDVDALWAGMLAGSVDDVLYPSDPIGDAPRIISELATLFPPARDHFVFAPTALIGWGTPTIVRAELAIVFEPPSPLRFTLVGLISSTLPTEDLAIIELHVAVLGKIDSARLRLAIDAKLYDSSIAGYVLTGDMAARIAWGFPPTIVVALGGLNPHFEPPAEFPTLERLTLVLGSGDNPKLTCQAYFAMTPNTLQFGVRAELYAAAAGFNIRGWVNFDCLVQQFPFSYRADMEGDVAFRRGDRVLASVHLEASITGPIPYHVWGKASLSLWLFSVSVRFDVTFGPRLPLPLPSIDPWPLLQAAIEDLRNWTTAMPAAAARVVTLRTSTGAAAPSLLDPGGAATLRQTVVPLNRKITRFGGAKPDGPDRYTVTTLVMNTTTSPGFASVTEFFAAAQFEDLSDTEKLSRPSFERMDAGMSVGHDALTAGTSVGAKLEYETIILDAPWQRREGPRYRVAQDLQLLMLEQGASARSPLRSTGLNKFAVAAPPKVALTDDRFVIATTEDATAVPGWATAATKGAALAALAEHLKLHPDDQGRLQVLPEYELVSTP
jgi:hypothetical protein